MIHPIYLVSGLSGLAIFFLLLKRSITNQSNDQFIDMDDNKHLHEEPKKINKDNLPELVTIYLIPETPIPGAELLQFLLSSNLQYSQQKIFCAPSQFGNRFHVATLTAPGTFNLETINHEQFSGLSFFIQPRSSQTPLEDFDTLCQILFEAKDKFNASIQSTQKEEINLDALRQLRDVIANEEV